MDNLWNRRTNTGKLSLSTSGGTINGAPGQLHPESSSRSSAFPKRNGGDASSHSRSNPFNNMTPATVASPTSASSAFGLGSGAFASFGASKTPKTPGTSNPFEASLGAAAAGAKAIAAEKVAKEKSAVRTFVPEKGAKSSSPAKASSSTTSLQPSPSHPLRYKWVFWFRPPISKANGYIDYEKTLHPIAYAQTVEQFFLIYSYLKRPSDLPQVSDYHLFRDGIRPIWEDDINKKGGKWIVRLKKGVADRYWEDLLFAIIGDQFMDASEEVCGVVLSVRNGEDILSIWTKGNNGRVLKIRETMKHVLNFPPDTKVDWKSHDESIQQRTAIEESRREKAHHNHHHNNHHNDKRSNQKDGQKA